MNDINPDIKENPAGMDGENAQDENSGRSVIREGEDALSDTLAEDVSGGEPVSDDVLSDDVAEADIPPESVPDDDGDETAIPSGDPGDPESQEAQETSEGPDVTEAPETDDHADANEPGVSAEPETKDEPEAKTPKAAPLKPKKTVKTEKPKQAKKPKKKKSFGSGAILLMLLTAAVFVVICGWLSLRLNINGSDDAVEKPEYGVLGSYYQALTPSEKRLYSELAFCADRCVSMSEILPFGVTSLEFDNALRALLRDETEMFHIDAQGCAADTSEDKSVLTLAYKYDSSAASRMREELHAAAETMAAEIRETGGSDGFDTVLAAHDRLVSSIVKTYEGDNISNAYGALVEGKADAEGYAFAVREVLTLLDIPSAVIYGSCGGEKHVWNVVNIGDEWYHLDCWYDDADSELEPGLPMHAFFMVDDSVIADREIDTGISVPECGGAFDYYRRYGYLCGEGDSLGGVLNTAVNNADHDGERFIELLVPAEITEAEIIDLAVGLIKDHNATRTASMTPAPYPEARIYPTGRAGAYTIELYY